MFALVYLHDSIVFVRVNGFACVTQIFHHRVGYEDADEQCVDAEGRHRSQGIVGPVHCRKEDYGQADIDHHLSDGVIDGEFALTDK